MSHTPGPWTVGITGGQERAVFQESDPCGHICKFPGSLWGPSAEEKTANARLIAAAPDMLAVLKALQEEGPYMATRWIMLQDRVSEVIAKAEGREREE